MPRQASSSLALLVCLLAIPWSEARAADNTNDADFTAMSLEELGSIKVPTVFGASKHEQKVTEAPSSVSIVTREDIQKHGHRTLSDVLNGVRGIYVTYDRGYSYIGVRGFNRPGDFGGRVLLMVDGHRLNDGIYDTAASGTDFPLDVDLIERVEVIRGAGSSLYGNNAFFGVINVITRRGADVNGVELSAAAASFDTYSGRASYGKRFTNGVELLLSGTLLDSAGHERLRYPEFVAKDLDGGYARSAWASLSWNDFTFQGEFMDRRKDWPTAAYGAIPNSQHPRLFSNDQRSFADLKFQRALTGDWQITARTYFDRYRFDGDYPYDYDEDPGTAATVNRDYAVAHSAGLELSVSKNWRDQHRLTVGGEWRHDFELTQRNWDVSPRTNYVNSRERGDILGLYAQDEWSLRKNLILNAGVRYDHYSTFGDTVNPRAALIYTPWEQTTFKLVYGQAFRAPNAYEQFYVSSISAANPNLQPEHIRSYEIIYEQMLGPRWRFGVSAFWNDIRDLIDLQVDPGADLLSEDDDRYFFDNLGRVRSRGFGAELEGRWKWGLRGLASYTFTDARNTRTEERLSNSPQHMGKVRLDLPLWRTNVFAGLEVQAMSARQTVSGGEAGAYWLANFTLFSRELVKGLEFSASLYNLLDQRHSDPVSDDFSYTGPVSGNSIALDKVRQDGRSFRVKLTYRF